MDEHSAVNKAAWEHRTAEFWLEINGEPAELAAKIAADPMGRLKVDAPFFENARGMRIANPCGSCGRRAVALALLGAEVTVFDISAPNRDYAMTLAQAAETKLDYVVGDVYDIDTAVYGGAFDALYLEGGILHYFFDIDRLMRVLYSITKTGGFLLLHDFHPIRKLLPALMFDTAIGDYFYDGIVRDRVCTSAFLDNSQDAPLCDLRLYTVPEIINAVLGAGFALRRYDEFPDWKNPKQPGTFRIYATKESTE